MAGTLILVVGVAASLGLALLLGWHELSAARGRKVSRTVRLLTIGCGIVFVIALALRLSELLSA